MFFDYHKLRSFLEGAVSHYEKTAPALSTWLDDLYVSLADNPAAVSVFELLQLQQLKMNDEWEHPNYAQNRWYKVRALQGKDTGVLGY